MIERIENKLQLDILDSKNLDEVSIAVDSYCKFAELVVSLKTLQLRVNTAHAQAEQMKEVVNEVTVEAKDAQSKVPKK